MNEDELNNISYIQKEDDLNNEDDLKKGDNLKDKDNFKMFVQFWTTNSKFIPRPEYISFHWWECLHKHIVQLYLSPRSQYDLKQCLLCPPASSNNHYSRSTSLGISNKRKATVKRSGVQTTGATYKSFSEMVRTFS